MCKYILLLSLFSFNCLTAQTITGIIVNATSKAIGDETTLSEEAKKLSYYSYVYSKKVSSQTLIDPMNTVIDTIYKDIMGEKVLTTKSVIRSSHVVNYKNYNKNIFRIDYSQSGKNYNIIDIIPEYDWKLVDEIKEIAGFICKKATTIAYRGIKQHITAWYSEDIPINDGPMDFNGLPGMILQIEINDQFTRYFKDIKFIVDQTTDIPQPETLSPPVSLKEYEQLIKRGN